MRQIPLSICPEDAIPEIKGLATKIIPIYAGDGIMCALYEFLKPEIQRRLAK